MMLIVVFTVKLQWFPLTGMVTPGQNHGFLPRLLDIAWHLVLPVTALALFYLAIYTRLMRAAMLDILGLDYMRTARAKGLSRWRIIWRHGARNALLPMTTVLGLQLGSMFGGVLLIETVFGWPGLGRLAFEAVFRRDVPLVMGILFLSSVLVLAINLIVDLIYVKIDPRIELR
jgi:peptide/nickel transport system permease protein